MIATPLNLEILLRCHYTTEKHPRADVLAVQEGYRFLARGEMIEMRDGIWRTTAKGHAFIEYILALPFPVCSWTIPNEGQRHDHHT